MRPDHLTLGPFRLTLPGMATSKRGAGPLALVAGLIVLAMAAGLLHRRAVPRAGGASEPGLAAPGARPPAPAQAQSPAREGAALEPRRTLRTDTLQLGSVPEPGASAPAEDEPRRTFVQPRLAGAGGLASDASSAPRQDYAAAGSASAPPPPRKDERRAASSAPAGRERPPAVPGAGARSLSDDPRVQAAAGGLVAQAKGLKFSPRAPDGPVDLSKPANVRRAVLEQFAADARVDAGVRQALSRLEPSAGIEAQRRAVAGVLASQHQPADEISITNALARGLAPPAGFAGAAAEPSPRAVDAAINDFAAAYAGTPAEEDVASAPESRASAGPRGEELDSEPGPGYRPPGPAPRGAADAYKTHAAAFAAAQKNFGVPPWDILAIAQQETGFGRNMGRVPLPKGLARRQADLAAAIKLDAAKRLPAPWNSLRGSSTGALGPFQFEPATQLWAGRGDPFDWNGQIAYSVPHLLILNGYKADDPVARRKAFGRYYGDGNPNGKYALSVANHAAAIKPVIEPPPEAGGKH